MSLQAPASDWYEKPVSRDEKMWMVISLLLCIMLFVWMVLWHVYGKQNPSNITYKTNGKEYAQLAEAYVKKNMIGTDNGIPVVKPEPNSDVMVLSEMWRWSPVLLLKKDENYRLHISSKDVLHGLSIQPINMNFQVYPDYDYVLTFKPTSKGEYKVVCNEFCGIGHHTMIGKIVVYENENELKALGYDNLKKPAVSLAEPGKELTPEEMAAEGAQLFALKGCNACHKTDGTSQLAPSWNGLFGRKEMVIENGKKVEITVDEAYLAESILKPQQKLVEGFEKTMMPAMPLTEKEVNSLITYIKTIK